MKIAIINKASHNTHSTPVLNEMSNYLRQANIEVETIVPEVEMIDISSISVAHDLYVIRPGIELGLSLSGILHDMGALMVNSFESSSLVADKVRVTHKLMQNNIPTARSFITGKTSNVTQELNGSSIIVKPHRGSNGEGVRVLRPDQGSELSNRGGHFIQEYLASDGLDLKVYVIGDEVFAIKRPFPAVTYADKLGTPYVVTEKIRSMALRIGAMFGLDIYGFDIIETEQGPFVIDVNFFPSFFGIKAAPRLLSEYILDRLKGQMSDHSSVRNINKG